MADCSKTEVFLSEFNRLKKLHCGWTCEGCEMHILCPIFVNGSIFSHANEVVRILQDLSDKHPVKTFLDDFKEKHPNAIMSCKGKPKACRRMLYGGSCREDRDCLTCWKEEMT